MPKVSRTKALEPAVSISVAAQPIHADAGGPGPETRSGKIIDRASDWIAKDEQLTALQLRWQALETALFDKAAQMKLDCATASHSEMPEAREMRALDVEIGDTHRLLQAEAREIRLLRATTIAAAIAKVELGLKVQGQFDWRAHALELVEDGVRELRALL